MLELWNKSTPKCDILKAPANKLPNVPQLQRNKERGGGRRVEVIRENLRGDKEEKTDHR